VLSLAARAVTPEDGSAFPATLDAPDEEELQGRRLRELEERSAHLEAILESLPDSYARISAAGIFLEFRRPKGRDFVVPVEELRGRHFRDTLPADAAAAWQVAIDEANASGKTTVFEFILPTRQGRLQREARFTSCGNGEVIAVIRSTTQEKRAQAQLVLADRLASLGTLAAGVAHEINNPVAIMIEEAGWIGDLLADGVVGDPKAEAEIRQAAGEIATQGKRCREITHKLLSFARKTESTVVPADLAKVAAEIAGLARQKAKFAGVDLEVRTEADLPPVALSISEMQQVLLNLINNAIDAVSASGRENGKVVVGLAREGEGVVLSVADNGPGIAPEAAGRIFEPFFTTKPAGEGTGLGLSICRGLVAKMGGELRMESAPGRGATFFVSLRAADGRGRKTENPA